MDRVLDKFKTTIDLNDSLSDIDKSKYLNNKLTGEAKQAVSGIHLSKENYKVAKNLLTERCGDQQTVINSLFRNGESYVGCQQHKKSKISIRSNRKESEEH